MNLEFAWPWLALALPLPLLVRWLLRPVEGAQAALRVPALADFEALGEGMTLMASRRALRWLALLAWLLLVAAAARPQYLGEAVSLPASGRELMLAVDLSLSMRETDMQLPGRGNVTRLAAVKHFGAEFLRRREGDRDGPGNVHV